MQFYIPSSETLRGSIVLENLGKYSENEIPLKGTKIEESSKKYCITKELRKLKIKKTVKIIGSIILSLGFLLVFGMLILLSLGEF